MKTKNIFISLLALTILCTSLFGFYGCSEEVKACDLMADIEKHETGCSSEIDNTHFNQQTADFAVRLMQNSVEENKNTLISPFSVLCALAMTQNGAENETEKEMEKVLGMKTEELNLQIYSYLKRLPSQEKCRLNLANSIWFRDNGFSANRDFLQNNADFYGADAYKAPFDGQTLKDINNWVKKETDGMIPEILDEIPKDAVMYLINALAFDAEWENIYEKDSVRDGTFVCENGDKKTVPFMNSNESRYFNDGQAQGFLKYYSGRKYAFAAFLPNEGTKVTDYVKTLDGKKLHSLLSEPKTESVIVSMPKFETEYSKEMSDCLKNMGMKTAFDGKKADFSGLGTSGEGNIFIGRVIHKTYIKVSEKGTKAGAATAVEMQRECAAEEDINAKKIILDRPFVYMIVDCENSIPLFIGTMIDPLE